MKKVLHTKRMNVRQKKKKERKASKTERQI